MKIGVVPALMEARRPRAPRSRRRLSTRPPPDLEEPRCRPRRDRAAARSTPPSAPTTCSAPARRSPTSRASTPCATATAMPVASRPRQTSTRTSRAPSGFGPEATSPHHARRLPARRAGVYDKYYYPAQQVRTLITARLRRRPTRRSNAILSCPLRRAPRSSSARFPTRRTMYLSDIYTISLNIAGNGGMNLPIAFGSQTGMPVGLQIIGPQFRDDIILRVAAALEAVRKVRHARRQKEVPHKMKELEEVLQDWEAVIGLEIHAELDHPAHQDVLLVPHRVRRRAQHAYLPGLPGPSRRSSGAEQGRHPQHRQGGSCHQLRDREALDVLPQGLFLPRYGQELPDHAGPRGILHARAVSTSRSRARRRSSAPISRRTQTVATLPTSASRAFTWKRMRAR